MEQIKQLLADAGLTPSEIAVYRAGLSHGPQSAAELTKRTGIKRPTVYHALDLLLQKGLASKTGNGVRLQFSMTHPSALERLVDNAMSELARKKDAMKKLAPLLLTAPAGSGTVHVEQFEGAQGVKTVVDEALYCASRKWDIIAPGKNFFSEFDAAYAKRFMETRRARSIVARSLWEKNPSRRVLSDEELRLRNPRFLPKALVGKFSSVVILFDDKIALIPPKHTLSAVLIRSKDIHTTLAAMFEGLWLSSEPYRSR